MKLENVKVRMKVVPHAKTGYGDNFNKDEVVKEYDLGINKYLIVANICKETSEISLWYESDLEYDDDDGSIVPDGDFFYAEDFELYVDGDEVGEVESHRTVIAQPKSALDTSVDKTVMITIDKSNSNFEYDIPKGFPTVFKGVVEVINGKRICLNVKGCVAIVPMEWVKSLTEINEIKEEKQ